MSAGVLEIEVKLLKQALADVVGVVEGRNTVPILSHVLLSVSPAALVVEASDLDMWVSRHVGVIAGGSFATTCDAQVLRRICDKLPGDAAATLQLADGRLTVTSGRARFQLPTLPVEDFPRMPARDWDAAFEMPALTLGGALGRVGHAISTEEARYYLNGVFVHRQEAELCFAATDGHRLARMRLPAPDGTEALPAGIVPRKAVRLIGALLDHHDGSVDVQFCRHRARFEIGATTVDTKLIDGEYPDYQRVIPTGNDKRAAIDREALIDAIVRVTVVAAGKDRAVKLAFERDLVRLTVRSPEHGEAAEELPCQYDAPPFEVGFNAGYLLAALGQLTADTIEAVLADGAAPTLWRDGDDAPATFVVMPVRV